MSRALIIGGLALVVLGAAGGAYYFWKKGGDHHVGPGEHVAAPDGTAAGAEVKDTLGTDEGGGIADDASAAVDAVDEGGDVPEGGDAPSDTPQSATGDVFDGADKAAMHDEEQPADNADQPQSAGKPN